MHAAVMDVVVVMICVYAIVTGCQMIAR